VPIKQRQDLIAVTSEFFARQCGDPFFQTWKFVTQGLCCRAPGSTLTLGNNLTALDDPDPRQCLRVFRAFVYRIISIRIIGIVQLRLIDSRSGLRIEIVQQVTETRLVSNVPETADWFGNQCGRVYTRLRRFRSPETNITEALLEISGCVQNQTFGAGQEKACTTCIKKIQILPKMFRRKFSQLPDDFLGTKTDEMVS